MKSQFLLFIAALLLVGASYGAESKKHGGHRKQHATPAPTPPPAPTEQRLQQLEEIIEGLSRQVMLQQFYNEEENRGSGDSGLKNVRQANAGTNNYYYSAHSDNRRFMAIHDHANYDRTVGLGELDVVMNGVEFRTRHNDYKLKMPSTSTKNYNQVENIPFPDVPPSVLNKKTVEEQIHEMREYFRAFKTQNVTHRDYRPYFKANLCYMEGGWVKATADIDEPFSSDRHHIDAASWFDLMEKIQFTSYTGGKSVMENYAWLPTTIYKVENGKPLYAQWNYRIVCHPLSKDLPTSAFKPLDDLMQRFPTRKTFSQQANGRAGRFTINSQKEAHYTRGGAKSLLDNMMMEIPGKDNYLADLHDSSFGMKLEDVRYTNGTLINTGFYHRYFKSQKKGAMGIKTIHRGFNDGHLWTAQTSNPKVIDMTVNSCKGHGRRRVCTPYSARYTYALPVEVVYMTPLSNWNPYDLPVYADLITVTDHGNRTGERTVEKAYRGVHTKLFYQTPAEFYSGFEKRDAADTSKKGAGVLDKEGNVRIVASSGPRIFTPKVEGVGSMRLRYPIMPLNGEGSAVWKELNALKDMTMHMNRYSSLFEERPGMQAGDAGTELPGLLHYEMTMTVRDPPGEHTHEIILNQEEMDELKTGHRLTITTSQEMGHSHVLEIQYRRGHMGIRHCDGAASCWDGHDRKLHLVKEDDDN